jgi:hypothetical protein
MKTKKNVHFHIFNEVMYIPRIVKTDLELWYSVNDYRKFQLDMMREITLLRLWQKSS